MMLCPTVLFLTMGYLASLSAGWETASLLVNVHGNIVTMNDLNNGQYGIKSYRKHKGHYIIQFTQNLGVTPVAQVSVNCMLGKGLYFFVSLLLDVYYVCTVVCMYYL